jgi:hypothetical protein
VSGVVDWLYIFRGTSGGLCEHCHEPSASLKCRKCLNQL